MDDVAISSRLQGRLALLEERLAAACRRAGRPRAEVLLVAVTKTVSAEVAGLLPALGVYDLGENRPQELWRKAEVLAGSGVRWHLIGHLQRNKIERTFPLAHMIHSVDSLRLLQALEEEASRRRQRLPILLEVNASGEENKHGLSPGEVPGLADTLCGLSWLEVKGLMTMAAHEEDPERCRPTFALLRGLRDRLQERVGGRHTLSHLSMGMSNDFEVAVEEGATLVRLGSVLFEGMEEVRP